MSGKAYLVSNKAYLVTDGNYPQRLLRLGHRLCVAVELGIAVLNLNETENPATAQWKAEALAQLRAARDAWEAETGGPD